MVNLEGYKRLGNAVILQAVKDYMTALRKKEKNKNDSVVNSEIDNCEEFFRKRMKAFTMADIDGNAVIKALQERARMKRKDYVVR